VTDTIFALSSGAPPAAIAVVRISGPAAEAALELLAGSLSPPRHMALRTIRVGDEILDRGLIVRFPAESSVTGEPLAELHLHGGRATVDAVLTALANMPGLRPARAGEFTWRAFENGRMDLVEVESLSDLLRAETESQRRAALSGQGLSDFAERCRRSVLHISALVEAGLDQSDEDDVRFDPREPARLAQVLIDDLSALLDRPGAERLFDGVRVVFAGPPNSGKSTLINTLAQREVAIVSPIAGTTRDVIEAPVKLGGVAFVLTDTAGLREDSADPIEQEGIDRARRRIEDADIIVWMDDDHDPPVSDERIMRIAPRADISPGEVTHLRVSAVTGEGITDLIDALIRRAKAVLPREGDIALTRRQHLHLANARAQLCAFIDQPDELLAAEHLRRTREALDRLSGRAGTEEMLDALFGTFCVGK
jgi:tRNA modification GTPase